MLADSLLPLSPKGKESVTGCEFLTVWEGAVRSGKTISSTLAYMLNVITSPDHRHLMIGRSQASILSNCVDGEYGLIALSCGAASLKHDKSNELYIDLAGKRIDLFGGENVSSFKAFRGRSYGSTYIDEANLQHPNTIAEGFNRTIAAKKRQHFMTLNPDIPTHWLYTDYLDKYTKEQTKGFRLFHFTLDDNPALSEERKEELKSQYTNVFYKRFILGLRVRAEGGCYPSFSDDNILTEVPKNIIFGQVGVDIGGGKSATTFCLTGFFMKDKKLCCVLLEEHYDKENYSSEKVISDFKAWAIALKRKYSFTIIDGYCDSAEQLIKKSLDNLRVLNIHNSLKKPIIDRVRFEDLMFAQKRMFIMAHVKNTINSVYSAVWDMKGNEEKRLDNGSINIDSLDCFEYSFENQMGAFI